MSGVFVTGTDTGVGKTVVAACCVRRWGAHYWKPVQTGLAADEGDTAVVARLAGVPPARLHPPRYALQAPLSPEAAGGLEGVQIALTDFVLPTAARPLVVEGAGGVLVPLGNGSFLADLMSRLGLPALLVARPTLGTINHTLLSLEALRARGIAALAVVLCGVPDASNEAAIERHGGVAVWRVPHLPTLDAAAVARAAECLPDIGGWGRKADAAD